MEARGRRLAAAAAVAGLAALACCASLAAASGAPCYEDWDEGFAKKSEYKKHKNLIVKIDEDDLCRAEYDNVILFDENGCDGDIVGSIIPTDGACFRDIRWMARRKDCWESSEARSMLIRGDFPQGGTITVCDGATDCTNGAYATITFKKKPYGVLPTSVRDLVFVGTSAPPAPVGYCITSFEHSYEDIWVKVEYDGGVMQGGLDGGVSRIGACLPGVEGNMDDNNNTMPYDGLPSEEA